MIAHSGSEPDAIRRASANKKLTAIHGDSAIRTRS